MKKNEKKCFDHKKCFWLINHKIFVKRGNKPHKWTALTESFRLVPFWGYVQKIFSAAKRPKNFFTLRVAGGGGGGGGFIIIVSIK
jgi:hypothetical protein